VTYRFRIRTKNKKVKEGDPKRELCKAAEEWDADCIFGSGSQELKMIRKC